jgi:CheY-like chemotaxis protein
MMPQVDGLDVLRFVRSHEGLSSLPVISELAGVDCCNVAT